MRKVEVGSLHLQGIEKFGLHQVMDELNSRAQSVLMYGNAPGWKPVTSSVPDNPILGLILFSSFNSNTYAGFECILGKLADDVK